jgi:PhzF family phenazine biosynthesis protein
MGLPETAFLRQEPDGYGLRWFTPEVEVEFCGHATLASAHVLWRTGALDESARARFHTRSGLLTAAQADGWIDLDFPAEPMETVDDPGGLADSLGVEALWVGRNRMDYMVEVASENAVRGLAPDLNKLAQVETRGVIVTAAGDDPDVDFVSRFFAPRYGVNEDPVTGSAHCALAPFWGARLGRDRMTARQISTRGGVVRVAVVGDRVRLSGQAVTVMRGELL